jgi:Zn-finger nucleic acid-binding protein
MESKSKPVLRCPLDDTQLEEAPLGDVHLAYCPECQGIWLTREAFEQLIEQATRDARRDEDAEAATSEEETTEPRSKGLRSFLNDLFG